MNHLKINDEINSECAAITPFGTLLWGDWSRLCNPSLNEREELITEDKERVYFEANAPGVKADEIEMTLDEGILTVKAETAKSPNSPANRARRYFYRVRLSDTIDTSRDPRATFSDGVIRIVFDKRKINMPKKISIGN